MDYVNPEYKSCNIRKKWRMLFTSSLVCRNLNFFLSTDKYEGKYNIKHIKVFVCERPVLYWNKWFKQKTFKHFGPTYKAEFDYQVQLVGLKNLSIPKKFALRTTNLIRVYDIKCKSCIGTFLRYRAELVVQMNTNCFPCCLVLYNCQISDFIHCIY